MNVARKLIAELSGESIKSYTEIIADVLNNSQCQASYWY